ncbi:hypothetical protein SAMN04487843_106276 [Methylobacterium sp. ap11]|uniref:hypothetical protein n=1 Tax=Methylobacterium sp. ap11 TaxID=1761799 RepID=UPI0008BE00CE|nr:hypothetical protein [Methylobacterium sp. ap11]SEP08490.1 hypothetical protein SAMN04487843_106276 [Methylobacterium sp. ap11]
MTTSRDYDLIASSGLFDVNHYLLESPDVVADGADPLEHFCRFGAREGRRPNLYFDPGWYADLYLGGARDGVNPVRHYVEAGERKGLRPVCYFDPAWYAATYGLPRGTPALHHYLQHRRSQRYAPNARFDLAGYLARYGAEIGRNRDAFAHLLRHGARRDLDTGHEFDAAAYRARHGLSRLPASPLLADQEACNPLVHRLARDAAEARAPARRWWRFGPFA